MKERHAYKFRLHPNRTQVKLLEGQLDLCRELYNAALQERRDAYRMVGKSLNYYDQANQLAAIKEVRPDLKEVHSQVLQDVLKRVDKAFQGFFSRVKRGVKAGFPRFQGRDRYDSFTYPQGGWSITASGPIGQNNLLSVSVQVILNFNRKKIFVRVLC